MIFGGCARRLRKGRRQIRTSTDIFDGPILFNSTYRLYVLFSVNHLNVPREWLGNSMLYCVLMVVKIWNWPHYFPQTLRGVQAETQFGSQEREEVEVDSIYQPSKKRRCSFLPLEKNWRGAQGVSICQVQQSNSTRH